MKKTSKRNYIQIHTKTANVKHTCFLLSAAAGYSFKIESKSNQQPTTTTNKCLFLFVSLNNYYNYTRTYIQVTRSHSLSLSLTHSSLTTQVNINFIKKYQFHLVDRETFSQLKAKKK